jgi:hypothetical protein
MRGCGSEVLVATVAIGGQLVRPVMVIPLVMSITTSTKREKVANQQIIAS